MTGVSGMTVVYAPKDAICAPPHHVLTARPIWWGPHEPGKYKEEPRPSSTMHGYIFAYQDVWASMSEGTFVDMRPGVADSYKGQERYRRGQLTRLIPLSGICWQVVRKATASSQWGHQLPWLLHHYGPAYAIRSECFPRPRSGLPTGSRDFTTTGCFSHPTFNFLACSRPRPAPTPTSNPWFQARHARMATRSYEHCSKRR
jgi:hypothetical protein